MTGRSKAKQGAKQNKEQSKEQEQGARSTSNTKFRELTESLLGEEHLKAPRRARMIERADALSEP